MKKNSGSIAAKLIELYFSFSLMVEDFGKRELTLVDDDDDDDDFN